MKLCLEAVTAVASSSPAKFIFLELLQDTELRGGQIWGFAEIPDLLLDEHEPLKTEKLVVLI